MEWNKPSVLPHSLPNKAMESQFNSIHSLFPFTPPSRSCMQNVALFVNLGGISKILMQMIAVESISVISIDLGTSAIFLRL